MGLDATLQKRLTGSSGSEAFELNLHLTAEQGITVLLGPSGSGKTLTLNCIGGFVKPDAGRILLNDQILFDAGAKVNLPPEKRRCGYIFQDHALFPHMSVRDNLLFAAGAAPREKNTGISRRRKIKDLLESFELTELAARKPGQLSGGQKQRAALARILVSAPRLLLLDEPTRGLEARLRETFYQLLRTTQERLAIPVVLITHDVEECLRLADFLYVTERGRLLQSGTLQSVINAPVSVEVARVLGFYNLLPAEITALDPAKRTSRLRVFPSPDESFELNGPHLRGHLLGDRGTLCFRESAVYLSAPEVVPIDGAMKVRIRSANTSPRGTRLQFGESCFATVTETEWETLKSYDRVHASVPPQALYFIG